MRFAESRLLWLIAGMVPLLTAFFIWSWRKRQKLIREFVRSRLLAELTVGVSKGMQKARLILLVMVVALLLATLARPQWGFFWEESRQRGLDIIVAIDTSQSMLAEDISPNRLTRAKLAALDLMQLAKQDRLGLVAFAGTAFLQCPLTLDDEIFRQSVALLDTKIIPQGGTALAEALEVARTTTKTEENNIKALVILTDGEDQGSDVLAAAAEAAKAGLHVFTIGVGTPAGEILRRRDERGVIDYIKDEQGNIVKSRLNEPLLREVAAKCHGFYLLLQGTKTMQLLYERGLAPLPKSETTGRLLRQYRERFQWPLALAIALLLAEIFLPDRRRVSRSETMRAATKSGLKKAVAAMVLMCLAFPLIGSPSFARKEYEAGDYRAAVREYEKLLERNPNDPRLHYNAGTSAYRNQQYDRATNSFQAALRAPDLDLQQRSYYNLGNTFYQLGEQNPAPDQRMEHWEQALQHFESAVKLNGQDKDARHNTAYVRKKLEELKKQQPKPEQQKPQSNPDDQKKDPPEPKDPSQKENQKQEDKSDSQEQGDNKNPPENQKQSQPPSPRDGDGKPPASNQGSPKPEQTGQSEAGGEAAAVPLGQMSPQEAINLLDAQRGDEKPLIFLPPGKKSNSRKFKDW